LLCWLNDRYRQSHSFGDRAFDLVPNKNLGKSGPAINIDLIMHLSKAYVPVTQLRPGGASSTLLGSDFPSENSRSHLFRQQGGDAWSGECARPRTGGHTRRARETFSIGQSAWIAKLAPPVFQPCDAAHALRLADAVRWFWPRSGFDRSAK